MAKNNTGDKTKDEEKTLDEWRSSFTRQVLEQVFASVEVERKTLGSEFADSVVLSLIASMISTLVYKVLSTKSKEVDIDKKEEIITKLYLEYKTSIENGVSAGFQNAFNQFTGEHVDFYCEIKPVPEPINKLMC